VPVQRSRELLAATKTHMPPASRSQASREPGLLQSNPQSGEDSCAESSAESEARDAPVAENLAKAVSTSFAEWRAHSQLSAQANGTTQAPIPASSSFQPNAWRLGAGVGAQKAKTPSYHLAGREASVQRQRNAMAHMLVQETTPAMVRNQALEAMALLTASQSGPQEADPRIQAMVQAVQASRVRSQASFADEAPIPDEVAGQEEANWEDVAKYMRGVGGNALRAIGVPHNGVRNLGLV